MDENAQRFTASNGGIRSRPIRGVQCLSIYRDDNRLIKHGVNHPFKTSIFSPETHELPVAEVIVVLHGKEVSIVNELTGRPGVLEVTTEMIEAARHNLAYANRLQSWIIGGEQ